MLRLKAACERWANLAAAVNEPASAKAMKLRNWDREGDMPCNYSI